MFEQFSSFNVGTHQAKRNNLVINVNHFSLSPLRLDVSNSLLWSVKCPTVSTYLGTVAYSPSLPIYKTSFRSSIHSHLFQAVRNPPSLTKLHQNKIQNCSRIFQKTQFSAF